MRKLTISFLIALLGFVSVRTPFPVLSETNFARIEKTSEIFRTNSTSTSIDNIICLAEETYFVEIISDYDTLYKVEYNGIIGFIKKTDVRKVLNTPITPYPYNIKILMNSNCNLRSTPTTKSNTNNVISTIYSDSSNIHFIGRVYGEEAIDFGGNAWYYVLHNGNYGYIYNNYVKSITPIYKNTENVSFETELSTTQINPITHTPSLIIIIILSIPIILVLIILYIPNKNHNKSRRKQIIINKSEDNH